MSTVKVCQDRGFSHREAAVPTLKFGEPDFIRPAVATNRNGSWPLGGEMQYPDQRNRQQPEQGVSSQAGRP
jgi:hypothetical protein